VADMSVQIVAYDPRWPQLFTTQREHLAGILRRWLSGPIEHVGSTAVPGLASKPIIDILAPVTSLADARGAVPLLGDAGWLHWADDPNRSWRIWFLRPRIDARTHHLYLIERGDPHIDELLTFRDLLRSGPDARRQYEQLKYHLAMMHRYDRDAYTQEKSTFVETLLQKNGIDPLPRQ
jgi:GrpB-like predicted nucleotidyltransferase (UPF0157 family)